MKEILLPIGVKRMFDQPEEIPLNLSKTVWTVVDSSWSKFNREISWIVVFCDVLEVVDTRRVTCLRQLGFVNDDEALLFGVVVTPIFQIV